MDLVSGAPFWPIADGLPASYPALDRDVRCQVAIIGAGVTGALVADALASAGLDVVVLDRRDVASGSTAASTALLQYEIDIELYDLIEKIGEARAVRAYQLCLEAIPKIEALVATLADDCGFTRRSSLYLASRKQDAARLEREATLRASFGLPAEYWDRRRIRESYAFKAEGAIRSTVAGQIDPYRLTHALLQRAIKHGARVYDRTAVTDVAVADIGAELATSWKHTVRCHRVVYAQGYEVPKPIREELVSLHSTYALATEPLERFDGWDDRCLIWETARPYCYLRSTDDGRILIGGEDEPFANPRRRDRRLMKKAEKLGRRLDKMFPSLKPVPAYAWTGTFGETADGLAYIGEWPGLRHGLFALGYGANGISFGVIGAELLRDACLGVSNPDAEIFRLDR